MARRIPAAWNFAIDFVGPMNRVLLVSALACVASLVLLATRGLNLGTDFAGGTELQVAFAQPTGEDEIRALLAPLGLGDARVQRFGAADAHEVLILARGEAGAGMPATKRKALGAALGELAGGPDKLTGLTIADNGEGLRVGFSTPVAAEALRARLTALDLEVAGLQAGQRQDRPEYNIRFAGLAERVAKVLPAGSQISRVDFVGPQVGAQLRNQGLMAVLYALAGILVYVAIRFDMVFSPGAILATLHDVIITMGFLSLAQVEFSLNVVAALLTLIGFSLNDTIVVYDRIRENVARRPSASLGTIVNAAINDTLSRTILTSGTVLLVTLALVVLGGPFIFGLSITMLVGVVVGTYSSIAVAAPLYMLLRRRLDPGTSKGTVAPGRATAS